ncbi:MAG: hypothetical protein O2930_02355 [Acidobacteria bacterium]|nr:hypothetical protein [Acidobacteriota bacterium]
MLMFRVRSWGRSAIGCTLLVWSLLAAISAVRVGLAREPDPIADLEAEFLALVFDLPPSGLVGYLEAYGDDAGTDAAVRMYFAAQYALAPRVVVGRVGPEFLIVARGTERSGGDPRLEGYHLIRIFPSGHRVYRRLVP